MSTRPRDTSADAERVQRYLSRRASLAERFERMARLCEDGRELARTGIRMRHPEYGTVEVEQALRRLLLGEALVKKAWPHLPVALP